MNAQKYTQKSLEAVQNAQSIATEYGNQQIEQPHLLLALLLDEGGLIPQLLGNMGLTVPSFTAAAKAEVEKLPRVSGSGRYSIYETGKRDIPLPHLVTLADYYKVSTDYLLGREKS